MDKKIIKINYKNWEKIGTEFYGKDKKNWKFKCTSCNHIQSVNLILEHNNKLTIKDAIRNIHCNCEGRLNKEYGCDWSLYGIFNNHKLIVESNGKGTYCFLFENEKANEKLKELNKNE